MEYQKSIRPLNTSISSVCYGHIGNYHLHFNFLPRDAKELTKAKEFYLELTKIVVKLGGTISAEHGLGKKTFEGKPLIYFQLGDQGIEKIKTT